MISRICVLMMIVTFSVILFSTTAMAITNLVKNGDFEKDTEGWSFGADYGSLTIDKKEKGIVGNAIYVKVDKLGANPLGTRDTFARFSIESE